MKDPEQSGGWLEQRGFGGLDWASQKHSVVVVDSSGKVIEDFEIEHSALGWKKFRERMKPYGSIPFAIETNQGAAVEQLLEAGMQVYPLNPKSAQAYRERKAPSGVKDDRLDAWSFADALRMDGQNWEPLRPENPLVKELRLLCRDEVRLIEQRTAFINQRRAPGDHPGDDELPRCAEWRSGAPGADPSKMDAMNDLKGKYDDLLWLAHLDVTDREREIPRGLEAATECGR